MSQQPLGGNHGDLEFDLLDRLHKSMRVSGKKPKDLATDLGVHRNTVNNYLSGRVKLDRRTLVTWAFATGVPLEWLETGRARTDPPPDGSGYPLPADREFALRRHAEKKVRHAEDGSTHWYTDLAS